MCERERDSSLPTFIVCVCVCVCVCDREREGGGGGGGGFGSFRDYDQRKATVRLFNS